MLKPIIQYFVIISAFLLTTMLMNNVYAEEPKTFHDLINHWSSYSDEIESPYVYRISEHSQFLPCLEALTPLGSIDEVGPRNSSVFCYLLSNKGMSFCIKTFVVPSNTWTRESMLGYLSNDTYRTIFVYHTESSRNVWQGFKRHPGVSRFFLNTKHENDSIGNFSFDKRYGGFEGHRICEINFVRGNTVVSVFSPFSSLPGDQDHFLSALCDPDLPDTLDPREIAWQIDQYLKGDPLEKFGDDEKAKLKTLEITLPKEAEFEQGREYPLDFARKLTDGTVPAEVRLVVSRGEIQQVIDKAESENSNAFPNPASLAPDIDGKYTVLFGRPGKQTVHCYHINEEGKCLAWDEIEVFVKAATATILENDGGIHD